MEQVASGAGARFCGLAYPMSIGAQSVYLLETSDRKTLVPNYLELFKTTLAGQNLTCTQVESITTALLLPHAKGKIDVHAAGRQMKLAAAFMDAMVFAASRISPVDRVEYGFHHRLKELTGLLIASIALVEQIEPQQEDWWKA
jgi:hypothetical protein